MPGKAILWADDRQKLERARDSAMVRSLFYRGLYARSRQKRFEVLALEAELGALRTQDQLDGKTRRRRGEVPHAR